MSGHEWFRGDFSSWEEARRMSTGYDAPGILEKVLSATRKVKAGEAACERDSVVFDQVEYSLPLLASLLWVASRSGNRLDLLDFGGSLGSSYWQNRKFLSHLAHLRWSVVEQPHFVAAGRAEIADDVLRFHDSIDSCVAVEAPDTALLSGVLQCLEQPYAALDSILERKFRFVIIDRLPIFVTDLPDRITIETVPAWIYEASYPAWFFSGPKFRAHLAHMAYSIVEEFDSWERWVVGGDAVQNKCILLERGDG
jgi:putative methyltransferase (TIGR04325 family)